MGRSRLRGMGSLVALVAVALSGCARGEVSSGDLQQSVRDGLAAEGVQLRSAECPSGVAATVGATVVCLVELSDEHALGEPVDRVRVVVISVEGEQVRYRLEPLAVGVADDAEATAP